MKLEEDIGYNCMICQCASGVKLAADDLLRAYTEDINVRSWMHGIEHLSYSFSILYPFFNYNIDFDFDYFELLDEEDYEFSLIDFLDFVTDFDFEKSNQLIDENFQIDLIYNFNFNNNPKDFVFSSDNSSNFIIGSISIVRRAHEVIVLIQSGKEFDRSKLQKELKDIDYKIEPHKKKIVGDKMAQIEPVLFRDMPDYWKVNSIFRLNLEDYTIQTRYIAQDLSSSYQVASDDIFKYINIETGEFKNELSEKTYKDNLKMLEEFVPLEELAKLSLYIPYYLNFKDDKMEVIDYRTDFGKFINKPSNRNKLNSIPKKYKIISKSLWTLEDLQIKSNSQITLKNNIFKIEKSGLWKPLLAHEIGADKKGREVIGKTWVSKTLSWIEEDSKAITISKVKSDIIYTGKNSGKIYIMRNPLMPNDIFKIGLTRNETDDRTAQLSTTGVIDKFYVLNEWQTFDCVLAEKQIHDLLDHLRVDPRREFFNITSKEASKIIEAVVNEINKNAT